MNVTNNALKISVWNLVPRLMMNRSTSFMRIIVFLIQVTKLRRAGLVACMGKWEVYTAFYLREWDHFGDPGVDGSIIRWNLMYSGVGSWA